MTPTQLQYARYQSCWSRQNVLPLSGTDCKEDPLRRVTWVGLLVIGAALTAGTASGTTYVIKPDGLGDYPTIQEAVHAATDGDTIELTDGTFTGDGNRDIQVPSRPITICSQTGNFLECLIDCEGSARAEHRGFHFQTAIGSGDVTLEGIGIMRGYTTVGGGGIWVDGANTTIRLVRTADTEERFAAGADLRPSSTSRS